MIANYTYAVVLRLQDRYAILRLDNGEEHPALYSALPEGVKAEDVLCRYDNHWISERELRKKKNRRLRSLRSLLKGK